MRLVFQIVVALLSLREAACLQDPHIDTRAYALDSLAYWSKAIAGGHKIGPLFAKMGAFEDRVPSISYNFIGDDFAGLQSSYMSVLKRDFYEGDFAVKPARSSGEFVMERGTVFPTPILAMKSSITASVRRTWKHVRGSRANVYAIWLVRDGWLRLTQHGRTVVSRPGEIVIADSTNPFFAEAL